jgi:hypothetical protein
MLERGWKEKGPSEIEVFVSPSCFDDSKEVSITLSPFSSSPWTFSFRKIRYALTR